MKKQWMLLEPIRVGSKLFKNRIVLPAMETRLSHPDGSPTREMNAYYAERARGGVAAVIVENTFVDDKASRSSLVSSGIYSDHMIAGKYGLAQSIKENGALAILQISHGGRQANAAATGLPAVAPSAVPCKVVQRMPKPLAIEEIVEIEDAFAEAARRAKQAGFDGVEIHGAHGYLICSFLSPYTNKRTDEYGGSPENRARFPRNIIRKVREEVGPDFLVGYRLSGSEFVDGGLTIEDTCAFAKTIQAEVDYIHVSAGIYETMATWMMTPLYMPQAPIVHLAAEMKKAVRIPVITVGSLNAELGEKALEDGSADIVALGRGLIADPEIPRKLAEDRAEDIRPCMRGNEGCISLFFLGCPIRCEVNPQCGRELEYNIRKTNNPQKVVVIGGGVAGLEAARVASESGHWVTLLEQSDRLGGHFIEGTAPDFKVEARSLLRWLIGQVEKSKISVEFHKKATPELVASYHPDVIIVAEGSAYGKIPVKGIEEAILPDEALMHPERVGKSVVVIGGGLVGSETALWLAEQGKSVTIVEMLNDIVPEDEPLSQTAIKFRLHETGVQIATGSRVTEINDGTVKGVDDAGAPFEFKAETIIAATGLKAKKTDDYSEIAPKVFQIGDSVKARKIYNCFHEAWHAVLSI